jgi:hypothetical protein
MNELAKQFGYAYIFYGPSDQFIYLTMDIYMKPFWYALIDYPSLAKDMYAQRLYSPNSSNHTIQVIMPWGDIYHT